ncbi:uncharacterized protein LOC119549743 [Drosophila subpulchrella]|uniref:uncharacterized protein LOC119549743 n=1 Tax=Drosophila subpulchrella TaxID=1486046 RepID=UPI0018A1AE72|nr:uncharacterized protein LOC119549743 [Drosophila subpulchrella]
MKFLALIISTFLILSLASQMEARKRFYCLWSTKRTCSKSTPRCIRLQTGVDNAMPTYTCKYYRSDCQYLLDSCKGETSFGLLGTSVDVQTNCVTNGIAIGGTGVC